MPLRLSKDESRAVAFIGLLLTVSAAARLLDRPASIDIEAPAVDVAALREASRQKLEEKASGRKPPERLDPNTATVQQLMRLPGASRALAEQIVAERQTARFLTANELTRVRGIGPATVRRWQDYLSLPWVPEAEAAGGRRRGAETEGVASPAIRAQEAEPGGARAPDVRAGRGPAEPVDLNRASLEELERLPGIGPSLARRIVAYRDSVGGFRTVEQLEEVRGIGPALVRRLGPMVRTGS